MDVKSAYLHADINEEVYMRQPKGYELEGKVWRLRKSLYGLKQSGRNWQNLLHDYLIELNFKQSSADPCLYINRSGREVVILLVWVDDIILGCSSTSVFDDIKRKLSSNFKMKDLGKLSMFLGIKFHQRDECITMLQAHYLKNVLKVFDMQDCKPRSTPCELKMNLYLESNAPIQDSSKYRQMVGSLIYVMTCTRPDLAFAVTKLSQHLSSPESSEWATLKDAFQYVKKTVSHKLNFMKQKEEMRLIAHCDADWATSADRRSISGYVVSLSSSGPPISWKSKKQGSVALSTCEAEYVAMSTACQELIYHLISKLLPLKMSPAILMNNNQGALALIKNPVKHSKAKHIDIRYHFTRECFQNDQIVLDYVPY